MEIEISQECRIKPENLAAFATPEYLELKGNGYGYIYGLDVDNNIIFYCAFILKKKFIFSLAEFQTSIICLNDNFKHLEKEFLDVALIVLKRKHSIDFICQNPAYAIFDIIPANATYTYFGSYIVDLHNSEEVLWNGLHSKHRNVIRKAMSSGLCVTFNRGNIDEVYMLIQETQARTGNGFISRDAFEELKKGLGDRLDIIAVYKDDIIQGCAVMVHDNHKAYYLYGGSCEKPYTGAINFLHWHAILHYKSKGLFQYDFVGARLSNNISPKLHGIQRFKSRFGGELYKGFLWKYVYKKHKYWLYKIIYFVFRHKWKVDAIDEENITNL